MEMHKKYAKDGVVCMSISLDDLDQKDAALKFLKAKGATFANYLLDEDAAVWQKQWDMAGPPVVLVFDKDGNRAAKFGTTVDFTYGDVAKVVQKLLK